MGVKGHDVIDRADHAPPGSAEAPPGAPMTPQEDTPPEAPLIVAGAQTGGAPPEAPPPVALGAVGAPSPHSTPFTVTPPVATPVDGTPTAASPTSKRVLVVCAGKTHELDLSPSLSVEDVKDQTRGVAGLKPLQKLLLYVGQLESDPAPGVARADSVLHARKRLVMACAGGTLSFEDVLALLTIGALPFAPSAGAATTPPPGGANRDTIAWRAWLADRTTKLTGQLITVPVEESKQRENIISANAIIHAKQFATELEYLRNHRQDLEELKSLLEARNDECTQEWSDGWLPTARMAKVKAGVPLLLALTPSDVRKLRVSALARVRDLLGFFCFLDARDAKELQRRAAAVAAAESRLARTSSDPKWRVFFAAGVTEDEARRVDWGGLERLPITEEWNAVNPKLDTTFKRSKEKLLVMTSDHSPCEVRGGPWQRNKLEKCTNAYAQLWTSTQPPGVLLWMEAEGLEYYLVRDESGHEEDGYGVGSFRATCVLDKVSSTLIVLMVWRSKHKDEDVRYLPCRGDKDKTLAAVREARLARSCSSA